MIGAAVVYNAPAVWDCRECGGFGSAPTHRATCMYAGAGKLAASATVTLARRSLNSAERLLDSEPSLPELQQLARELAETTRRLLVAVDLTAQGVAP